MRTPSLNILMRATVALLLAATLGCTISGCGKSSPSATALLKDTFEAPKAIESGRLSLSFSLSGKGGQVSRPLTMKLSGPFEEEGEGKLPQFALAIDFDTEGNALKAGATSIDGKLYLELEGTPFVAPASTTKALQKSFSQASKKGAGKSASSTFAALGIEPGRWLTHPVVKGEKQVDGVATTEVEGGLDVAALLKDTNRLSGAAGEAGLGSEAASGLLSPKLITELAKSLTTAKVAVYTGNSDHVLRRLVLNASLAPKGQASTALGGLHSATLSLTLNIAEVGKPQQIVAPKNPKPLSQLVEVLEGIGLVGEHS
ncbi:MAG TPA: hypothetical protein VGF95_14040 [Solirubrobacteraceae bacterium]|jgi:hypothetical protein